jgi:hypothetical protein
VQHSVFTAPLAKLNQSGSVGLASTQPSAVARLADPVVAPSALGPTEDTDERLLEVVDFLLALGHGKLHRRQIPVRQSPLAANLFEKALLND